MKKPALILSCEHASCYIPKNLEDLLPLPSPGSFALCDLYAAELTQSIAKTLKCDYLLGNISRFVVDLNKKHELDHCISAQLKPLLSSTQKQQLLEEYYFNYRQAIKALIEQHIQAQKQVLHLSIHSFNPKESNGLEHNAAMGILYDSKNKLPP